MEKNYGVHVGCGGPCGQEGIGGKENNEQSLGETYKSYEAFIPLYKDSVAYVVQNTPHLLLE